MTTEQAYIDGFCKVAEYHQTGKGDGVIRPLEKDTNYAEKKAQYFPQPLLGELDNFKGSPAQRKMYIGQMRNKALADLMNAYSGETSLRTPLMTELEAMASGQSAVPKAHIMHARNLLKNNQYEKFFRSYHSLAGKGLITPNTQKLYNEYVRGLRGLERASFNVGAAARGAGDIYNLGNLPITHGRDIPLSGWTKARKWLSKIPKIKI